MSIQDETLDETVKVIDSILHQLELLRMYMPRRYVDASGDQKIVSLLCNIKEQHESDLWSEGRVWDRCSAIVI